jgi:hypothetical protein
VRRELVIAALAATGIGALSIPSMIRSLSPSLDGEIRQVVGDLHAARTRGGAAHGVSFGSDGRPERGRAEVVKPEYVVAIEADGRVSVRTR